MKYNILATNELKIFKGTESLKDLNRKKKPITKQNPEWKPRVKNGI